MTDRTTTMSARKTLLEGGVGRRGGRSRIAAWAGRRALHAALGGLSEGEVTLVEPEGERIFGKPSDALPRGTRIHVHDPRF
jgi:hypothetical protein